MSKLYSYHGYNLVKNDSFIGWGKKMTKFFNGYWRFFYVKIENFNNFLSDS